MTFASFFGSVTGRTTGPLAYQRRLGEGPWPDLLEVPTGLGKTAGVIVAWLYKRLVLLDEETPRRLVYCLPMRVLVEQTAGLAEKWAQGAAAAVGAVAPHVYVLMGGSEDVRVPSWAETPEADAILIGTQDMLLSRALMRGYGMSRYQWPVHFALVHNDVLWVFDEVQLMGPGLATSTQLAAFRDAVGCARPARSLWLSATLNRDWLATVDFRPHLPSLRTETLTPEERGEVKTVVGQRLGAVKRVHKAVAARTVESIKLKAGAYLQALAKQVTEAHRGGTTLVIVNTVERAQALYSAIKSGGTLPCLLLHSRFRPAERKAIEQRLGERTTDTGRIVVATQALEAGVDITSRVLFTELAPWPSMVQRFGRCNRYGEENDIGGSDIYWTDVDDDKGCAAPYDTDALISARHKLVRLSSAAPRELPATDEPAPLVPVLRRKDLYDLFDTDRDLSGFDVDISPYIRDTGTPQLQVFWRDTGGQPNAPPQPLPARDELCPISIGQAQGLKNRSRWRWDSLDSRQPWRRLDGAPRPGMTLMLEAGEGGYDSQLGFTLEGKEGRARVDTLTAGVAANAETYEDDWRSEARRAVSLPAHLEDVAEEARVLCERLGESQNAQALIRAARWHDVGKAHAVFQATLHSCAEAPFGPLAKSPCKGRHARRYFRHEVASMLAWLDQEDKDDQHDLIAYLIAAHHGKVRMSLRAMPDEPPAPDGRAFARGVWEGDRLLPLSFDGESLPETELRLAVMALGSGPQGPSWTARTQKLLAQSGPFRLAWLEALVRLADWRSSRKEEILETTESERRGATGGGQHEPA